MEIKELLKQLKEKIDGKKYNRLNTCLSILKNEIESKEDVLKLTIYFVYLREGLMTEDELLKQISMEDLSLVKTLVNLESFRYKNEENEAEKIREMFVAIAKDIRVVFIVLSYNLSRHRHLDDYEPERKKLICTYGEEIYAPLCEKFGLSRFKSEIEDICLKFLKPKEYGQIESAVNKGWSKIDRYLGVFKMELMNILKESKIEGFLVTTRRKHISSIYKKIKNKTTSLEDIYDFAASRVLVNTVEECYYVLGKIHAKFRPMPGRMKDYIASPKANGYKSLHTTVINFESKPIEVQIRTHDMHAESEYGFAAHFKYKEKRTKESELDNTVKWIRSMLDSKKNADEFLSDIKFNLKSDSVFVQTPKGKVIKLIAGSTVLDFAYAIHSDVGNYAVGSIVNGKAAKLRTELTDGDIVEIITSKNSKGPSREWISICKTSEAKSKIQHFFKVTKKAENIKIGRIMIVEACKSLGFDFDKAFTEDVKKTIYRKYTMQSDEDFYASIGQGSLKTKQITQRLTEETRPKIKQTEIEKIVNLQKDKGRRIIIDGDDNLPYKLANCCSPDLNDKIYGYISNGRGITIHKEACHNLKYLPKNKILQASWKK